tara:strand:- start:342 stop:698 length:357 start_codon:yes stop_codon:yes gene_type:complete
MPFDKKKYMKEWRENNKEYDKQWYQNNKEYKREQSKEYSQTPAGIKSNRITQWKQRGVKGDFDEIYDIYISTDLCDYCNIELVEGNNGRGKKCLDHDHETGEIRGILCQKCNIRDVLA